MLCLWSAGKCVKMGHQVNKFQIEVETWMWMQQQIQKVLIISRGHSLSKFHFIIFCTLFLKVFISPYLKSSPGTYDTCWQNYIKLYVVSSKIYLLLQIFSRLFWFSPSVSNAFRPLIVLCLFECFGPKAKSNIS